MATTTATVLPQPLVFTSTTDRCQVIVRWVTTDGMMLLPEGGILSYGFETTGRAAEFVQEVQWGLIFANPTIVDDHGELAVRADIIG